MALNTLQGGRQIAGGEKNRTCVKLIGNRLGCSFKKEQSAQLTKPSYGHLDNVGVSHQKFNISVREQKGAKL